ncbi:DUF2125 domain-containing protein [uncultured Pelagimonas sp.]|uniref:DUF2125 domain-containing protein n=1 Tax=uncultured Pelagimonas sp. TaxID=1618102 RepID=UPI00262DCF53|nr:DUF2125 domain-containing protein [uncultured Pelagimonas sp.]
MKRLIMIVVLAAFGWAGWWFFQAHTLRGQVETWFEERRQDGWVATYVDFSIGGFPNRLDMTFEDLSLANPDTNILWEAPFFQILSLSYKPDHRILIFPDLQTITTATGVHEVTSEGFRASVVFADGDRIDRVNAEATVLNWGGTALAETTAALLRQDDKQYQFAFVAKSIARAEGRLTPLAEGRVDDTQINTRITFDKDWAMSTLKGDRPQPTKINVSLMSYQLAALNLNLAGDLDVDGQGRASGELTLRAVNWQDALEQARVGQQLPGSVTEKLVQGLSVVAGLKGRSDTLDLPLRLIDGQMSLGLIPLGPAPLLQVP